MVACTDPGACATFWHQHGIASNVSHAARHGGGYCILPDKDTRPELPKESGQSHRLRTGAVCRGTHHFLVSLGLKPWQSSITFIGVSNNEKYRSYLP